jgi:hypothetical protein
MRVTKNEPKIKRAITLKELVEELNNFYNNHPEFGNYEVVVSSECGYSGANIGFPFSVAVPVEGIFKFLKIVTDDDGFTGPYTFYTNSEEEEWK